MMPIWTAYTTKRGEYLECKFALLSVLYTDSEPEFNISIVGKFSAECFFKKERAFCGDFEQAKRILISNYKSLLKKDIEFVAGNIEGVF